MLKYQVTVFDMDGTLLDSAPGVVNGFKYAIEHFGLKLPEAFDIRPCLGPPLGWSFAEKLGLPDEQVEQAIAIYREYYGRQGVYEAEPYPGIKGLLEDLNESGAVVCLATTKYSLMAEKMLDHFGLSGFIRHAAMATVDQRKSAKKEMIQDLLNRCGRRAENAVMIGDTRYDAEGASAAGTDFIGVTYGYGLREEMEEEGGRKFVADTGALRRELMD